MTDAFTDTARAEFTRRFQHLDGYRSESRQDDLFRVFQSGAQYASAQEPTDAEVEAVAILAWEDDWSRRWEVAEPDEQKPYRDFARAALTAVRNARTQEDR